MGRNVTILIFAVFLMLWGKALAQSDEARRHFDRGMAAVEMAKAPEDLQIAINEFKQATTLAPDWADAYFNLGKVQEAAEKFVDAIASYRKYLQLVPNAPDADAVQSTINKVQFKAENKLSIEDIVKTLNKLPNWRATDGCTGYFWHYIQPRDSSSINVVSAFLYYRKPDKYFIPLTVTGPIARYRWILDQCDPAIKWDCAITVEEEIEIVSRTRAKVRQVIVGMGRDSNSQMPKRYECELAPVSTLIADEFDVRTTLWEFRNADSFAAVTNGKLVFEQRKKGTSQHISRPANIETDRDFSIETDMKFVSGDEGSSYGILWGRKDGSNFHYFGLTANGSYDYSKFVNGAWSNLFVKRSAIIRTGVNSNKLAVKKRGGMIEFYINDQRVDSSPFENFSGGVGFLLNASTRVEIDYLRVTYQ